MQMMENTKIRGVVDQLKADIDQMSRQTRGLKNGERFKSVLKLHELRNILASIEEIESSVETLLEQQHNKRKEVD